MKNLARQKQDRLVTEIADAVLKIARCLGGHLYVLRGEGELVTHLGVCGLCRGTGRVPDGTDTLLIVVERLVREAQWEAAGDAEWARLEAMTDEEVRAEIVADGGDPDAMVARFRVFLDELQAKRRATLPDSLGERHPGPDTAGADPERPEVGVEHGSNDRADDAGNADPEQGPLDDK